MLVDRHNSMTAASFEPVSPIVLVAQKILQRAEQKCAEPAFLLICATQRVLLKQMGKKTLDEILRFGRSVTPKSQKAIKRWPIRFAEIGKRFSCCFRWIGLSSAQDQSPVRRLERRSALLQCSGYWFHNLGSRFAERKNAIDCRREFARVDDLRDLCELRAVRLRANDRSPDAEFFGFLLRRRLDQRNENAALFQN